MWFLLRLVLKSLPRCFIQWARWKWRRPTALWQICCLMLSMNCGWLQPTPRASVRPVRRPYTWQVKHPVGWNHLKLLIDAVGYLNCGLLCAKCRHLQRSKEGSVRAVRRLLSSAGIQETPTPLTLTQWSWGRWAPPAHVAMWQSKTFCKSGSFPVIFSFMVSELLNPECSQAINLKLWHRSFKDVILTCLWIVQYSMFP